LPSLLHLLQFYILFTTLNVLWRLKEDVLVLDEKNLLQHGFCPLFLDFSSCSIKKLKQWQWQFHADDDDGDGDHIISIPS